MAACKKTATAVNPVRNRIQIRTEILKNVDYAKFKKDVESIVSISKEIMSYQSYIEEDQGFYVLLLNSSFQRSFQCL